jgi:site-specific recombinase XerD
MKHSEPNIARHIKHFLAEYLTKQRGGSLDTVRSYRDALCFLLRYLQEKHRVIPNRIAAADLSAENIMGFLNDLQVSRKNSDSTRNVRLSAIRSFAKYLRWKEPTLASDLDGLLAIPSKRTTRQVLDFLTHDEMDAILEAPDADTWSGKRDRALFAAMYNTGARVSEIVGAVVSDVTLTSGGTFHLRGKGRKERVLPLWKRTTKSLSRWIKGNHLRPEQPLFANARGAAMTRSGVEKRLHEAVLKASEACPSLKTKRVSPHTLRHTTAMHLLQSGNDITLIAMWLGHESIETTHIYITTNLELKEKALKTLQPPAGGTFRFRPDDELMSFLQSL